MIDDCCDNHHIQEENPFGNDENQVIASTSQHVTQAHTGEHQQDHSNTSGTQHFVFGSSKNEQSSSLQNVVQELEISDHALVHPSMHLSRKSTSDVDRQNINVKVEYGESIDLYMRELEMQNLTQDCLTKHKVTPALRARMIDWMIEVLTNFKCDD